MGGIFGFSFGAKKENTKQDTRFKVYDETTATKNSSSTQTSDKSNTLSDLLASQSIKSGGDIYGYDSGQATTSSGGGQISQTLISSEGLDAILQKLMGGFEGYTSIASGSKKAGVYGSTTEAAQSADFLSKIIGEVARIMSPTITQELDKTVTQGARTTSQIKSDELIASTSAQNKQENVSDIVSSTSTDTSRVGNVKQGVQTERGSKGSFSLDAGVSF